MTGGPTPAALNEVLADARDLGFLGPGPVDTHIKHAANYLAAWDGPPPSSVVDLGSGGGVPALPMALAWPETRWTLVEANGRRARFLQQALHQLALGSRARVRPDRAELVGRDPSERGAHDAVVARGFGAPAVTVECGAPFLRVGGRLLTSEPPDERPWPEGPLDEVGLVAIGRRVGVMILEQR
ncbi:MAG: class I SAM-dependent methyltransferase, partial [Acidimicrobiia bacterium]|nr:class I SAM-dependent methyltransferase [Acidimicrobiia bacterium]